MVAVCVRAGTLDEKEAATVVATSARTATDYSFGLLNKSGVAGSSN
jgi:hypothetical protein